MSNALDFSTKRTVLAVDDTPENLAVLSGVLRAQYTVKAAPSGEAALEIAFSDPPPDLILLDIMMPGMDGYEVLRRLQADRRTAGIPVIFVTAKDQEADEQLGLDLGVVDYVTKPISPPILLSRVRNHLLLKGARDFLKDEKQFLQRERDIAQTVAIKAFSALAAVRDDETANHTRRMQYYVKALCERLKSHPRLGANLTGDTCELIFQCVPLHDMGKAGVPDSVLYKQDELTPDELAVMKKHTTIGRDVLERSQDAFGDLAFLRCAMDIVYSHQEKWDGSGYPEGLKGDDIPVAARMVALADLYDLLVSRRPHKPPIPHAEAAQIVRAASGSHLDPDVVAAFVEVQQEFCDIAARFADTDEDLAERAARFKGA